MSAINDWALRRKIAEACGWLNIHATGRLDGKLVGTNPKNPIIGKYEEVPDYFYDLNAIAEARASAIKTDQQWIDYWVALCAQVKAVGADSYTCHESYKRILSATARDHAEAFIKVIP